MRNHLLTDLLSVLLGMVLSVVPCLPCLAGGPAGERSALDDLPSRHITALAEGPDGYLWLGTRDGLYRYSGSGVRAYLHTDDPASLPATSSPAWSPTPRARFGWPPTGASAPCGATA